VFGRTFVLCLLSPPIFLRVLASPGIFAAVRSLISLLFRRRNTFLIIKNTKVIDKRIRSIQKKAL
jgi:hypothetical protein